jgi:hypothetical protein
MVTTDGIDTAWEFVLLDSRPYKTVELALEGLNLPTERVVRRIQKMNLKDAVVRVKLSIEYNRIGEIDRYKINEALDLAGIYTLASYAVFPVRDSRSVRMDKELYALSMPPEQLLEYYLKEQMHMSGKELEAVMESGKQIMRESQNE